MRDGWELEVGELRFANRHQEALALVRAFMHLLKAGELGIGGMVPLALARIYRFGHPAAAVDVDKAEAARWYKRAIEQGSAEVATEAVAELQEVYKKLAKNKEVSVPIHRLSPITRTEC